MLTLGNIDIKNLLCIQQQQQQQSQPVQPHSSHQQNGFKVKKKESSFKTLNEQHILQHQARVPKIDKTYEANNDVRLSQQNIDYQNAHLTAERKNSIKSNSSYGLASLNSYNSNSSHGTATAPPIFKYAGNSSNMAHEDYAQKFNQSTAVWNESVKSFSHQNNNNSQNMSIRY